MDYEELLLEIARCPRFFEILEGDKKRLSCCKKIVSSQKEQVGIESDFQLPEPWNGNVVQAPILVVSSNPSISEKELYPTKDWPDEIIIDFFVNRFKDRGEKYSWVYRNRVLNKDGSRGEVVRYWASIKNRVKELILREPIPGVDYCITELVHCKSKKQEGVMLALGICAERYFHKIVSVGNFKLIMAVGKIVEIYFNKIPYICDIPVIYLPHPNSFIKKTVEACEDVRVKEIKKEISTYFAEFKPESSSLDSLNSDELVKSFINKMVYSSQC